MKYLKNFKSLFEFDSTAETTNDIFDLWKRYRMVGPSYVSGIKDDEWELQDIIDTHEYSREWSGIYIDENDLEWEANVSVSKGNDEIEQVDYVEMPIEVFEKIQKVFLESLKSFGCEFKTEVILDQHKRKNRFILTEDEFEDFTNKIPTVPAPKDFHIKFEIGLFKSTDLSFSRRTNEGESILVYQLREGSNSEDNYLVTKKSK
jgi:hypothetical protein